MSREVRIAMVAGEASGDLLASHLIVALKSCLPQARFFGIGGPKMDGKGFDSWYPLEKLAVRGYVEVMRHYREISAIRKDLKKRLLADPPDVFIGIDGGTKCGHKNECPMGKSRGAKERIGERKDGGRT